MRQRLSFALIVGFLAMTLAPAWAAMTDRKIARWGAFAVDGGTLRVQFWSIRHCPHHLRGHRNTGAQEPFRCWKTGNRAIYAKENELAFMLVHPT